MANPKNLFCFRCGLSLNRHSKLKITNDPEGYRCKSCYTVYSWADGMPLNYKGVKKK